MGEVYQDPNFRIVLVTHIERGDRRWTCNAPVVDVVEEEDEGHNDKDHQKHLMVAAVAVGVTMDP